MELITQGVTVKIGQVHINLGKILNTKKFSIPTTYPLVKCYDKTASVKLSVEFDPINEDRHKGSTVGIGIAQGGNTISIVNQRTQRNQRYNNYRSSDMSEERSPFPTIQSNSKQRIPYFQDSNNQQQSISRMDINWTKNRFKSRIAQQQNILLHNKIQQYEQRMEKFRSSQQTMTDKLHQEVWKKDQKIAELEGLMKKHEGNYQKVFEELEKLKESHEQAVKRGEESAQKGSRASKELEDYKQVNEGLRKQVDLLRGQVEVFQKNKDAKDKHYKQQLQKYSNKFMASEHEKNLIILETQTRVKQQKDKYDKYYRQLIKSHQSKLSQMQSQHKQKYTALQSKIQEQISLCQEMRGQSEKRVEEKGSLEREIGMREEELLGLRMEIGEMESRYDELVKQLQVVKQKESQREGQSRKLREELREKKAKVEEFKVQINLANGTIAEHLRKISKMKVQIQGFKERENQLTEMYEQQLQLKEFDSEYIKENNTAWQNQNIRLKGKLKLAQQKTMQEQKKVSTQEETIYSLKMQIQKKKQSHLQLSQQTILLESENSHLRRQLKEADEIIHEIREQNEHLNRYLAYKNSSPLSASQQSQKLTQKVQSLQKDLTIMLQKYKNERHQLSLQHQQEISKIKNEGEKKLRSIQNQLHQIRLRKNDVEKDNETLMRDIEELKEKAVKKEQILSKGQGELREVVAERDAMRTHLESLKVKLHDSQDKVGDTENKYYQQRNKNKTLKNAVTKFFMSLIDKFNDRGKLTQSFQQNQSFLQQELDREVISYVNLGVKKFHDSKLELEQRVSRLNQQLSHNLALIQKLKRQQLNERQSQLTQLTSKPQQKHLNNGNSKNFSDSSPKSQVRQIVQTPSNTCNIIEHIQLSGRCEEYKSSYNALSRQYMEGKSKLLAVNEEVEKYRELYEESGRRCDKVRRELEQANEEIGLLQGRLKDVKDNNWHLQEQVRQLHGRIQSGEEAKRREKNQTGDKKATNQLQKLLIETQNKFAQISTKLEQAKQQLQVQNQRILQMTSKISSQQEVIREREMKIAALDQSLKYAQGQIGELEAKIREQSREIKFVNKDCSGQLEEVREMIEGMKEQKQALEKQVTVLVKKNQALNEELREQAIKAKKSLQEKDRLIQELQMREETNQLEHRVVIQNWKDNQVQEDRKRRAAQQQLEKTKAELKVLSRQYQDINREIGEWQHQCQVEKENRKREQGHYEAQMENLKSMIQQKETEKEQIKFFLEAKILSLQKEVRKEQKTSPVKNFNSSPKR